MQGEFEKQVHQKMEQLNLTPSEPVWQNIRLQINKKKDRKRFLIWFILFFLFIGGGLLIVLLNQSKNQNPSSNKVSGTKPITQSTINDESKTKKVIQNEMIHEYEPVLRMHQENNKKVQNPVNADQNIPFISTKQNKNIISKNGMEVSAMNNHELVKEKLPVIENRLQSTPILPVTGEIKLTKISEINIDHTLDSIPNLNTVPRIKRNIRSKNWIVGIHAGIGSSDVVSGLNLFSENKDALSTPLQTGSTTGGSVFIPSSREKKGLSFSLGAMLQRPLAKRFLFSTGLSYQYLSTHIQVGESVRKDTSINYNNRVVFLNQFYRNSSTSTSPYTNQFHFLSLPVNFNLTLSARSPFSLNAGLSIRHLIYTNNLIYNSSGRIYFKDKNAYTTTQLFSDIGFSYSFPYQRSASFSVGPQLQYGISNLLKEKSNRHLFSFGINGKVFFTKNNN